MMTETYLTILVVVVIYMMVNQRLNDLSNMKKQMQKLSRHNQNLQKQLAALTQSFKIGRQQMYNTTKSFENEIDSKISKEIEIDNYSVTTTTIIIITVVLLPLSCFLYNHSSINNLQKQQNEIYNQLQEQIQEKILRIQKDTQNPIADDSPNRDMFRVFGKNISLVEGKSDRYYQLIGKVPLSQSNSVSIKILKQSTNRICIGVIDRKYISDKSSYIQLGTNYIYSNGSGKVNYNGNNKLDDRYQVNDTVSMSLSGDTIKWSVNGVLNAEFILKLLNNQKINLIPCIWMFSLNDAVEWQ